MKYILKWRASVFTQMKPGIWCLKSIDLNYHKCPILNIERSVSIKKTSLFVNAPFLRQSVNVGFLKMATNNCNLAGPRGIPGKLVLYSLTRAWFWLFQGEDGIDGIDGIDGTPGVHGWKQYRGYDPEMCFNCPPGPIGWAFHTILLIYDRFLGRKDRTEKWAKRVQMVCRISFERNAVKYLIKTIDFSIYFRHFTVLSFL
jgi:hypothetical protein